MAHTQLCNFDNNLLTTNYSLTIVLLAGTTAAPHRTHAHSGNEMEEPHYVHNVWGKRRKKRLETTINVSRISTQIYFCRGLEGPLIKGNYIDRTILSGSPVEHAMGILFRGKLVIKSPPPSQMPHPSISEHECYTQQAASIFWGERITRDQTLVYRKAFG